jgi:hypothetical protein
MAHRIMAILPNGYKQILLFATLVLISGGKCLRKVNGKMKKEIKKLENPPIGRSG